MARPYAREMLRLAETFAWSATTDIQRLRQALTATGLHPLRAVGSGGSLTLANVMASLHERYTGRLASFATPLEVVEEPLDRSVATWLLSAGGANVDILAAARRLVLHEPRQLGALCGRSGSPLAKLCLKHRFVDLLVYELPAGKDGFLATNSLFGFAALLTRAYADAFCAADDWHDAVSCLEPLLLEGAPIVKGWEATTAPLWVRPTTVVLHGRATRIGAIDLESKFTEAALGHLQVADYRNFAHGRHHWLAKRGATSGVLAFITESDREIAERTLEAIPSDIPQARVVFEGRPNTVALASLLAALRLSGWAGSSRGIDPGRPGVPEFGRKLYRMPLSAPRRETEVPGLGQRESASISRKAGVDVSRLAASGELASWRDAYSAFTRRLCEGRFVGVVLDYDGTVVDARDRFVPARPRIATELLRIAQSGALIGVATGRGASVRRDLQKCLPRSIWPRFVIGYYNGADIAALDDDGAPDGSHNVCAALEGLADALRSQAELATSVRQHDRRFQITLEAIRPISEERLWTLVSDIVRQAGNDEISLTCSSHSIDILAAGVSKLNVVSRIRELATNGQVLTIGDRGRWPGNDHELLREPYALGVDQVSVDPLTCWHLGTPGQRGPTVTLDYLSALSAENGRLQFEASSLK